MTGSLARDEALAFRLQFEEISRVYKAFSEKKRRSIANNGFITLQERYYGDQENNNKVSKYNPSQSYRPPYHNHQKSISQSISYQNIEENNINQTYQNSDTISPRLKIQIPNQPQWGYGINQTPTTATTTTTTTTSSLSLSSASSSFSAYRWDSDSVKGSWQINKSPDIWSNTTSPEQDHHEETSYYSSPSNKKEPIYRDNRHRSLSPSRYSTTSSNSNSNESNNGYVTQPIMVSNHHISTFVSPRLMAKNSGTGSLPFRYGLISPTNDTSKMNRTMNMNMNMNTSRYGYERYKSHDGRVKYTLEDSEYEWESLVAEARRLRLSV